MVSGKQAFVILTECIRGLLLRTARPGAPQPKKPFEGSPAALQLRTAGGWKGISATPEGKEVKGQPLYCNKYTKVQGKGNAMSPSAGAFTALHHFELKADCLLLTKHTPDCLGQELNSAKPLCKRINTHRMLTFL